jgi:hypothetical protein
MEKVNKKNKGQKEKEKLFVQSGKIPLIKYWKLK